MWSAKSGGTREPQSVPCAPRPDAALDLVRREAGPTHTRSARGRGSDGSNGGEDDEVGACPRGGDARGGPGAGYLRGPAVAGHDDPGATFVHASWPVFLGLTSVRCFLSPPPQVLAVVTNVNARLDAMEATVNTLADSGGRLDALEETVATLQADMADGQANFQAVRGLVLVPPPRPSAPLAYVHRATS